MGHENLEAVMLSYAEQAVAAARGQQIELDYSEESLKQVEAILGRLEDPIPAGFEVIDPALLTNSQQAGVSQQRIDANRGPFWFDDWSQSVIRDEKVALFSDFLPKGTYEYTYLLRATVPGTFNVMPSIAYQAYQPEVFGRSDSAVVTVEP